MTITLESITEKQQIYESLREVIDPELMINIVDLGLVYEVMFNSEKKNIIVYHTLTSIGCPMGDIIIQNIEEVLGRDFPEYSILVQLVWQPKWNIEMASEEGRFALTVS